MAVSLQTTIKNKIVCTGVGLHSGQNVRMTLDPADADTGIEFRRVDVDESVSVVKASFDSVGETMLGTTIANEAGTSVSTIEHLMAALAGLGVDNLIVELDGPEVPIMDGSSKTFVSLVECAGIKSLPKTRKFIKILTPIIVEDAEKRAELHPADGFTADFEIDFDCPVIRRQRYSFDLSSETFKEELSQARTFGYLKDVEQLRSIGLAQGGALENTIVIDGESILNEDGLRFSDEFVRHKVLDAIGDLYLAGAPIIGHFVGIRSGHGLNNAVLRALFDNPDCWTLVEEVEARPMTYVPANEDTGSFEVAMD